MLKIVAAILPMLALAPAANAQVFSCEDNGRKVYQSTPCTPGDQPIRVNAPKLPPAPPIPAAAPATTKAEEPQTLQKRLWDHARREQVAIGMTAEMVEHAWGKPDEVRRLTLSEGSGEQWIYQKNRASPQYVSFENGTVSAFSQ